MSDKLKPETAARLLRAKAAELESIYGDDMRYTAVDAAGDLALLFSLVADIVDREVDREGPWVPIGDPLFNEDGTPWSASP